MGVARAGGHPPCSLPARLLQLRRARQQQPPLRLNLLVGVLGLTILLALFWSTSHQKQLRRGMLVSALCSGAQSEPAESLVSAAERSPLIEFGVPGLRVPLMDALDVALPMQSAELQQLAVRQQAAVTYAKESAVSRTGAADSSMAPAKLSSESEHVDVRRNLSELQPDSVFAHLDKFSQPQPPVFVIAVISECSSVLAQQRRTAIRRTWARQTVQRAPETIIRFFLAQPPAHGDAMAAQEAASALLQEEVQTHNGDMVMLRGEDLYTSLPNKTIRMLEYITSMPANWTHMLKTDDDCFIRLPQIIQSIQSPTSKLTWHKGLYLGIMENAAGYIQVRDPASKWYTSLPDGVIPKHTAYLAGWAYILSRDVAEAVVATVTGFAMHPETQPVWFTVLQWEDVMIGMLVDDIVEVPITNGAFKAAWRSCTNDTAVKHLDVDAPLLMDGLAAQEASGLWTSKSVQCSTGSFVPGDYQGWLAWRRGLPDVARI